MDYHDILSLVPPHHKGKTISVNAQTLSDNSVTASDHYRRAREKLLDVNRWHEYAGWMSAQFQLFDERGKQSTRPALKGGYIRVDIPGPGSTAGEGYDWVWIEEWSELPYGSCRATGFRVRPCANPNGPSNSIAHFYDDQATSSFWVLQDEVKVAAFIVDRNVKPNDDTQSIVDKLRDTPVAISALGLFSQIQWRNLVAGWLR